MKYCSNCGAQMQDNERFCPQCGKDTAAAQQPVQQYNAQPQQPQYGAQQQFNQGQQPYQQGQPNAVNQLFNTADTTASFNPMDIQQNKVMAVVSYLGILALIPYFGAKQSPYAQYHAKQGMNLLLVNIAVGIITFLLGLIKTTRYYFGIAIGKYTPGWVHAIQFIFWLPVLALAIIGIVYAAQGKAKELPIVGKFIKVFK